MFFDLQQGKSLLKKRQRKKNNMYEGFENSATANDSASAGGNDLDKDLNVKNKSNADNDTELVNQLNALEDDFNLKKSDYAATYKTLMDKTQNYMTSADYKNTAINNNVYVNHVIDTTSMVPTRVGCYKSKTTNNSLVYQEDLGTSVTSDICKTRAADLGKSVYALQGAAPSSQPSNNVSLCYVGDDVDDAKSGGYAYKTITGYEFVTKAGSNIGGLLLNGQVGIYQDSINNVITIDTNTPLTNSICDIKLGGVINTSNTVASFGGNCPNKPPAPPPTYNYDYIGYFDSPYNDLTSISSPNLSVADCKTTCSSIQACAGFAYAPSSSTNTCWLKNSNMYPKGSKNPSNGGEQLFVRGSEIDNTGTSGYTSLGCFNDRTDNPAAGWAYNSEGRALTEIANIEPSGYTDVQSCVDQALVMDPTYDVIALQSGTQCFAGHLNDPISNSNLTGPRYKMYGSSASCGPPSGYSDGFGGPYLNSVYSIVKPPPNPPPQTSLLGNYTTIIKNLITGMPLVNYIVAKTSTGAWEADPAVGCAKDFTANYTCGIGTDSAKTISIDGESGGKTATFDCSQESTTCAGYKLTIDDTGKIAITDVDNKQIWSTTSINDSRALPTTSFNAASGKYGRNYLNAGEFLNVNEFIGSPSGNYYLMMVGDNETMKTTSTASNYTDMGCWNDDPSRTLKGGPGTADWGYNPDTCYQEALTRGSNVFAVQDGGQCFTSSSPSDDYKRLGPATGCSTLGGSYVNRVYTLTNSTTTSTAGSPQVVAGLKVLYTIYNCTDQTAKDRVGNDDETNFVYQINKASRDYLGKVGYINNDGALQEYSSDMIQPTTDYDLIGNYDSVGYDLSQYTAQNITINDCNTKCSEDDNCAGYVFNQSENTCYLKNATMFPYGLRKPDSNTLLYTRSKKVSNDVSCPKAINNTISADEWSKMPVGEKMKLTTLCKLGLVTSADQADLDEKSNALTNAATKLENKIDDLVKNDMNLVKKLGNHVNKLQKDLKQYTSINKKIGKNENTIEGLSGFSTDTELNMISNNYRYLLFTILAIFLVGTIIKLSKK